MEWSGDSSLKPTETQKSKEEPQPRYETSKRGYKLMHLGGYKYCIKTDSIDGDIETTWWHCFTHSKEACKATVVTQDEKIIAKNTVHDHKNRRSRRDRKSRRDRDNRAGKKPNKSASLNSRGQRSIR
ncbi:uncharacterized protein LOC123868964 [Maniola jurtina]|uniref:uncharacterized protein LOC123868964 n=1 Tax=Maniola jurtina TaxID=191418 RepID=UPI001E68FB2E|nr:uncharacterized protein LOC123868964 [Maniola jurtina]